MPFNASDEHSPLSGLDEYLVHNFPHPVRVMWTTDAQAYERIWFSVADTAGVLMVVCGLAFYPNLGTAEAYALVNIEGEHHAVRAHRLMSDDRMVTAIGPLSFDVVEPFKQWRLRLAPNDSELAFDIRWFDTKRAVFRNIGAGVIAGGKPFGGVAGYDAFGVQDGWVEVSGKRYVLDRGEHNGSRDHHWGTRDGVGGPAMWSGWQHPTSGGFVQFADWAVFADHILYNLGDPRRGSRVAIRRTHRLRFESETDMLVGGEMDLELPSGEIKRVTFEQLGQQVAYLRCAMYGGPNGGTPDGNLWHGMRVTERPDEVAVSHVRYNVNDPQVRMQIRGLDQHHMRFQCDGETAYGLFEAYDPLCYQTAARGRGGLSIAK
ncbi:hypothetical protein [Mycobacterium sp. 1245805.9]|uniref:hypothetical protein n=1 Tax=Mycobacterium sp. 1245805.9 TaxID=1856862 RepID=UPI0007FDC9EB|nr:hypothetical protein [Mycobacterium sp. 1245805.9]OBI94154.1 hypothetical protein A9X00_12410 [Mycobacterium sp. 1245805.9]